MKPAARTAVRLRRRALFLELQFDEAVTQTRMLRAAPDLLWVGYTRSMLATLWLQPRPRTIGIIGMGGGAQLKFCHRHLPQARIEAVDNSAAVLALREAFRVPPDGARLRVVHGDGAQWLQTQRGRFDLLLIDAYDLAGIPANLSSRAFYAACRSALARDGVLASNLYATDTARHHGLLRQAFAGRCLLLPEPGMSNQVAIAWNGDPQPRPPTETLRALPWSARWQLRSGFRRLAGAWQNAPRQ